MSTTADLPAFAQRSFNLASSGFGARAVSATDEFFAPLARMLNDSDAVFIADKYDDNGKWMDGWETRRRRNDGHDVAVVALATCGRILGFDVDTAHFTGNYAPACRIEACHSPDKDPADDVAWVEILGMQELSGNAHNYFPCENPDNWTHIRLHIYPDGGVARLRVFGVPQIDPETLTGGEFDLASALNGGRILEFSDAHYGSYQRLLAPGRGENMGDGWETQRRRGPGFDWIIIALGARGEIDRAVVDTAFFKGNFPDRCSIQAADLSEFSGDVTNTIVASSMFWSSLLPEQKLSADAVHEYTDALAPLGPVTHVRLNIFPDGGISRLKLFGRAV